MRPCVFRSRPFSKRGWYRSGPRLATSLTPNAAMVGGDLQFDERDFCAIRIINRGSAETVLTGVYLFEYRTRWQRWEATTYKILRCH